MLPDTVLAEIVLVARELDVEPAALAAVAHIESGLRSHALIEGRVEPLIRFEGHYFDRRLSGAKQEQARREGVASPHPGAIKNPATQAARWRLLDRAAAIDRRAAYESVSWGIGQVMGSHWAWLGYGNVDALVGEARSGVRGQLRLMARYIEKSGLAGPLRNRDWASFARGYNGPGFRRNGYDGKLAKAYARYGKAAFLEVRPEARPRPALLRIGHRGAQVMMLQEMLAMHGASLRADGIFGPQTDSAVRAFQRRHDLAADGIAGPATQAALERSRPQTITAWIMNVFARLRTSTG